MLYKKSQKKKNKLLLKKSRKLMNKSLRKKSHKILRKKGGELIDAGGNGCIFYPALRCKGAINRTDGISKLLIKQVGLSEWNLLKKIINIVKHIPNYEKYFLLANVSSCTPDNLTINDLKSFERCSPLINEGISLSNINNNLDYLNIINQPFGGTNLDKIIKNRKINFFLLNKLLINLIEYAIVPMNNLKLYHFDLKGGNLLYNNKMIRIIDWGHSGIGTEENVVPECITRRHLQYNLPFSSILFSTSFKDFLSRNLSNSAYKMSKKNLHKRVQNIVLNFYFEWKKEFTGGHDSYINDTFLPPIFNLNDKNNPVSNNLLIPLLTNYCTEIVMKYTNFSRKYFDDEKYFKEVFSRNCDIWGVLVCYYEIVLEKYFDTPQTVYINDNIIKLMVKYCFSSQYAAIPINISQLKRDLLHITYTNYSL